MNMIARYRTLNLDLQGQGRVNTCSISSSFVGKIFAIISKHLAVFSFYDEKHLPV